MRPPCPIEHGRCTKREETMGLFSKQMANVVEWEEWNEEMIFWKWTNQEIKKGSRLILRPGQDAIFMYNGKIEGIFKEDGEYDIESQILPFLSTLKGFKFGFNSGMRAEVLFINTKEFLVKWGTRGPINLPSPNPSLPGGLPVRANGTFTFKVNDEVALIDKIAGARNQYAVADIKQRITALIDQLLMKWITQAGKDLFNLQANAFDIAKGIQEDLDMQIIQDGVTITSFTIMSFNYPEEVQKMINRNASHNMIGSKNVYTQVSMADSIASGHSAASSAPADMAAMMMGMQMGNQMVQAMSQTDAPSPGAQSGGIAKSTASSNTTRPKFCPNCGSPANGANFCSNCGQRLI